MFTQGTYPHTYIVGTAPIPAKSRVKIKAGTTTNPPEVEVAGATDESIGLIEYAGREVGDAIAVRHWGDVGIYEAVTADPLAVGDELFGAADGKVGTSESTIEGENTQANEVLNMKAYAATKAVDETADGERVSIMKK
ncbi:MAG: hypothetical protein VSS52_012130 [Thiotrichaceae bacterium]|nr:hypothetical protein [Thiotrichaceae bacterium]